MQTKALGGVLIILGISIGAGMLMLPVATAAAGFLTSSLMLLGCWVLMTVSALIVLEIVFYLPEDANLISIAKQTIGQPGAILLWFFYLFLFYVTMCAYISSSSDVTQKILFAMHSYMPRWGATALVSAIFGGIVYRGIGSVDIVNRGLMLAKIIFYVALVVLIAKHIQPHRLLIASPHVSISASMIMITSFAFSIILPSLRRYFNSDWRLLRRVVIVGSLIPLIVYLVWIALAQGVIPLSTLNKLAVSQHATTDLAYQLSHVTKNVLVVGSINFFVSICALTSFLGVTLALFDFLADGFGLKQKGKEGILLIMMVFTPPTLIVLFAPGIFIKALAYVGILCLIVLVLFPAVMAWAHRYIQHKTSIYQVCGGKPLLAATIITAIVLIAGAFF